uniref:Uncharacterized protein n=1 Tax=Vespula pensylvanica TaxID=30213 RepID=A0A834P7N1_VESPE|nr:hypothetical protein H0235_004666 [Vespula pensylvanica]
MRVSSLQTNRQFSLPSVICIGACLKQYGRLASGEMHAYLAAGAALYSGIACTSNAKKSAKGSYVTDIVEESSKEKGIIEYHHRGGCEWRRRLRREENQKSSRGLISPTILVTVRMVTWRAKGNLNQAAVYPEGVSTNFL